MILQALYDYYERKAKLGDIAPVGFEWKAIPFLIVIDKEGNLKYLKDTREKREKKLVARSFLVPKSSGRCGGASWKITNLLWDHWGYVLGYPKGDALKDRRKRQALLEKVANEDEYLTELVDTQYFLNQIKPDEIVKLIETIEIIRSKDAELLVKNLQGLQKALADGKKQLGTFNNSIKNLPSDILNEFSIKAIQNFYSRGEYLKVFSLKNWMDCANINGANITFQIEGETELVLASKPVFEYQKAQAILAESSDEEKHLCLITGKEDFIERIHAATPLLGGQATGKLVGFQKSSGFDSYGKEQAYNAPVGRYAQIAYTTALNTLSKSEFNRVFIGDTTILFWAEQENTFEKNISLFLTKPKDDPNKGVHAVKELYESIYSGKITVEGEKRFYVLGLTPNAARVSVRYWLTGTVAEFAQHIKQHFDDLEIVRNEKEPEFFALSSMLSHTALDYKLKNVAPNLAGQVTEALLKGTPYPQALLHSTIRRIRAEQHITRTRAAIIKACINRFNRFHNKNEEEITMSLDKTNENPAYLLGRLFGVLERVQEKAFWDDKRKRCTLNSTIRDRYYGSFSSAPLTVLPQLMKLKEHHLAKYHISKIGEKRKFDNEIGDIMNLLDGSGKIPRQFNLDEQGRFAVGYYHQRQDMKYKAKETNTENSEEK